MWTVTIMYRTFRASCVSLLKLLRDKITHIRISAQEDSRSSGESPLPARKVEVVIEEEIESQDISQTDGTGKIFCEQRQCC